MKKFAEDENAFASLRKGVRGKKRLLNENDLKNILNVLRDQPLSFTCDIRNRIHLNC